MGTSVSVLDFGAVGDAVTDDRVAIQKALDKVAADGGGTVRLPERVYMVGKGSGDWNLIVQAGVELVGEDDGRATLFQAPNMPANVRLLHVAGDHVTLRNFNLNGGPAQTPDEHRAGIYGIANALTIDNVHATSFSGDGFYLHTGCNRARVTRSSASGNRRNGITLGGGTVGDFIDDVIIEDSVFVANVRQQVDSELGSGAITKNVIIRNNVIGQGGGDYVLTVSGSSTTALSTGWRVYGNDIDGGINVVWATDVVIRDNKNCTNTTGKPSVTVFRTCDHVTIADNDFTATVAPAVIDVFGTGTSQSPDHVVIERNRLRGLGPMHGVHVVSSRNVQILDNDIVGPGVSTPFMSGVHARATVVGEEIKFLVVRRNRILNWGQYAVTVSSSPGLVRQADVSDNVFDDTAGCMLVAMSFDMAKDLRQRGNLLSGGCATALARNPLGVRTVWGDGDRWTNQ